MALGLLSSALTFGYGAYKSIKQNDLNQSAYRQQKRLLQQQTQAKNTASLKASAQTINRVSEANRIAAQQYGAFIDQNIEQLDFNADWLRDVWQTEQMNWNEMQAQLAFKDQQDEIQLAKASGRAAASGKFGVSADRLERQAAVQLGLNRAMTARRITGQVDALDHRMEQAQDRIQHEANSMKRRASIMPTLGKVPEMQALYQTPYLQQPSSTGMWTDLIAGGLNFGISAYQAMNPPTV